MGFDGVWGAASNPAKLLSRDGRGLVSPLDGALLGDDELVDRHGDRRGDRLIGECTAPSTETTMERELFRLFMLHA